MLHALAGSAVHVPTQVQVAGHVSTVLNPEQLGAPVHPVHVHPSATAVALVHEARFW